MDREDFVGAGDGLKGDIDKELEHGEWDEPTENGDTMAETSSQTIQADHMNLSSSEVQRRPPQAGDPNFPVASMPVVQPLPDHGERDPICFCSVQSTDVMIAKDDPLKQLMMSWYWAGYYTGFYQGQEQAVTHSSGNG